jgi:hypothetical protein
LGYILGDFWGRPGDRIKKVFFSTEFRSRIFQESDFALADLSLTPQRSQAVDFSPPFQTFASTIVTRVKRKENIFHNFYNCHQGEKK